MSRSTADDPAVTSPDPAATSPDPAASAGRLSTSSAAPGSRRVALRHSEHIKLRRGLTFLGMTLVMPGSAQMAAGNKRVGRLALRVWAVLWALLLVLCLLALVWRSGVVGLLTFGPMLRVVQVVLIALAICWGALLLDAWRISRPPELARRHRLGFALLTTAVTMVVVGGLVASASIVSEQRDLMASVFSGGGDTVSKNGRYNILLMGGDAGKGRTGLRPDSMTVASVDEQTGRTVLLSLPRNLEDVPFPTSSPLHKKFPKGYGCKDHSCMLNAVYTYATGHKELYPGVKNPGAKATEEAVEGATGLKINYYVLIDLKGFQALVDAVGGINMDISRKLPIGGGPTHPIYGYVPAGKNVHLDGYLALWYARSRSSDSDYARIARQKCVMSAMLNQLDPVTVLTKFNKIATAGKEIVETNIPTSVVNQLMGLAMKAKAEPISSIAFVPPLIYPGQPDFAKIRSRVGKKIAAAEAADAAGGGKASATPASPTSTAPTSTAPTSTAPTGTAPTSGASASSPGKAASSAPKKAKAAAATKTKAGQETDDLGGVCSAR